MGSRATGFVSPLQIHNSRDRHWRSAPHSRPGASRIMRKTSFQNGSDPMVFPSKYHKLHRLTSFDYSSPGSYLLTFNTVDRKELLSTVVYRGMYEPATVRLTRIGKLTEKYILRIPDVYPNYVLDNYVIMPDHVHVLLTILQNDDPEKQTKSVETVIRSTKTLITKELGYSIWQPDFYDVIADTEERFMICDKYIDENPAAWLEKHDDPFIPK